MSLRTPQLPLGEEALNASLARGTGEGVVDPRERQRDRDNGRTCELQPRASDVADELKDVARHGVTRRILPRRGVEVVDGAGALASEVP